MYTRYKGAVNTYMVENGWLVGWLVVLRLKSVGCYVHVDYKRNNTMVRLLLLR